MTLDTVGNDKARDPVIEVRNISKVYRIWREPADRLKSPILNALAKSRIVPSRYVAGLRKRAASYYKEFPALQDISFSINKGESVGIVGINGAGKSTLLQILTRVLQPSSGETNVRGKVAALLELGSGFNPLFSGRENVFLNASILGLTDKEIKIKMKEILDFADIGEFIDQPVQTYSSGMRLRLAFSVQIVVDPDVLIVDEALAVGDVFFQAKCMLRLRQLQEKGTTILFVSHSTSSVMELCSRALLLDKGKLIMDGKPGSVVQQYLSISSSRDASVNDNSEIDGAEGEASSNTGLGSFGGIEGDKLSLDQTDTVALSALQVPVDDGIESFEKLAAVERMGNSKVVVKNAQLINNRGEIGTHFEFSERVNYRLWLRANENVKNLSIAYHIKSQNGSALVFSNLDLSGNKLVDLSANKEYLVEWQLDLELMHGKYYIGVHLSIPEPPRVMHAKWEYIDLINLACMFTVGARKTGMLGGPVAWGKPVAIRYCES